MASHSDYYPISVIIDHIPSESATYGRFMWEEAIAPRDTYTIDLSSTVALELDGHFPSRPSSLMVNDSPDYQDRVALGNLMGTELSTAVANAKTMGMFIMTLSMSRTVRLAIAQRQLVSPSTPLPLRRSIRTFLGANQALVTEPTLQIT